MDTQALINRLVASGVLVKSLTDISAAGATDIELKSAENRVGTKLDPALAILLRAFNGANLDVVRFHSAQRLEMTGHGLRFADDPAGFAYYVTGAGSVICEDTDGGEIKKLAFSVSDFIHSYLFGSRAAEFAGEEWHQQLVRAGITR
jgi:hypothetical protein